MTKPISLSQVREIQKPFSAEAMIEIINDKIKSAAEQGKDVVWVHPRDMRPNDRSMFDGFALARKSLTEATEKFKEAGYTVTHFPGDQRESESWSIRW